MSCALIVCGALCALSGACGGTGLQREDSMIQETCSGRWSPGLTDAEQETLFTIAEDTLQWGVAGEGGDFDFSVYTLTPKLETPYATFVTLTEGGALRGCIGSLAPQAPLYRSVHDNALNAALRDPRFAPVRPAELPGLKVAISVLGPIEPIESPDAFVLGEHGIILEKGIYRAVYLPEVAPEQGWSKEETLASLSMKAGLPPDAWQAGCRFKVFSSVKLEKR
ncbi:MAG: AmmeMemoRadiSam system protein A [Lentisphaerae bacterium]|nr:AmmeMemoRadiSam system protein A [Lentisphaerota bacterium]